MGPAKAGAKPSDGARFAIVTLLAHGGNLAPSADGSRNGWEQGAMALGCSLQSVLRLVHADLLAMCFGVSPEARTRVESMGWQCITPKHIPNPFSGSYWRWGYTQVLAPFSLIDYAKVLLLDDDIVVVEPELVAGLLLESQVPKDHILASRDCLAAFARCAPDSRRDHGCWTEADAANEINSGVVVLRPNITQYHEMVEARHTTRSVARDGQGFLSTYFTGRVRWLPARYNYICNSLCIHQFDPKAGNYKPVAPTTSTNQTSRAAQQGVHADQSARNHLARGAIGLLHFQYKPKPWLCKPSQMKTCGATLRLAVGVGTTRIDSLHEHWHRLANRTPQECSKPLNSAG